MKQVLSIVLLLVMGMQIRAQEKEKPFKVDIHGIVWVNTFYDSRQSATSRNGNIYLFPSAPNYDAQGNDINDKGSFDIDASLTRLNLGISGPEIMGAKSFAFVEGDFLGDKGSTDLTLRLRHAFIRLNWDKSTLLVGQYWHPLFIAENYPATVTLNAGAPYHPLNRQPQIRFGHKLSKNIEILAFAMLQNDFSDKSANAALQDFANSARPEFDIQAKYKSNNFYAAFSAGHKSLRPSLTDANTGLATDEVAQAGFVAGSIQQKVNNFVFKAEAIYGGGMTNQVMIGGFAEKDNASTQREYTPIRTMACWADISGDINKWQPGLFIGYSENLGASENANAIAGYILGGNIGRLYSLSPRIKFFPAPKICLGLEWLYTVAGYGTLDAKAKPVDLKDVNNSRLTTSIKYSF